MEDTQGVILSITLWLPHKYTNENSILKIFLSNNLHSAPLNVIYFSAKQNLMSGKCVSIWLLANIIQ